MKAQDTLSVTWAYCLPWTGLLPSDRPEGRRSVESVDNRWTSVQSSGRARSLENLPVAPEAKGLRVCVSRAVDSNAVGGVPQIGRAEPATGEESADDG